jgi:peptidoglycan/xylan/chitin deacetylase (PgdA/CDA1 family)
VIRGCKDPKTAAITLDDGPSIYTPNFLDYFKNESLKATFFVIGTSVEKFPAFVKRVVAEGHLLGSHTWDHPGLPDLSDQKIEEQMNRTSALLRQIVPSYPITYMRPPFGAIDDRVTGKRELRLICPFKSHV